MRSRSSAAALLLFVSFVACGGGDGTTGSVPDTAEGEVLVSAAASLSDAFSQLAAVFEADHPEVHVVLNLGGSSALREQILEGAPVDVFAPADEVDMDRVREAGEVSAPVGLFAGNRMVIAVPAGNPAGVSGLADFADPGLLIGLCAAEVPCGRLARQVLERAGVDPVIDTVEPDVRALLTKIETGELDAGITYVTDVDASGARVEGIDIAADVNVTTRYPIAVLRRAHNPAGAAAFVEFVQSSIGSSVLASFGFAAP